MLAFEEALSAAYPASMEPMRERAQRAELACAMRVPERVAEALLGEARVLHADLSATLAQLAEGRFSYRHAQILIDETSGLHAQDRDAIERLALGSAGTTTASVFRRRLRRLREKRNPETMVERVRAALTERSVTLDPARDGMAYLTLYLGAVEAAAIWERADQAAVRAHSDGGPRTLTQLRADLLVDALLDRDSTLGLSRTHLRALGADPEDLLEAQNAELGTFRGIVPTVVVTVPVDTLLGGTEPGHLEGVGPIDPITARRLTAEAPSLFRLLTDPENGAALSLSRASYRIPEPLRRWLRLRDETCRFPGCTIAARRSDIDHTRDWHAHDGPTNHDNLAHLSRSHHTLKHHGGWTVRQTGNGNLSWTSYLGRDYTTAPAA